MSIKNELRVKHDTYSNLRANIEKQYSSFSNVYQSETEDWEKRSSITLSNKEFGLNKMNLIRFMPSMNDSFSTLIVEETQFFLEPLKRFGVGVFLIQGNKITSTVDIEVTEDFSENMGLLFGVQINSSDKLATEFKSVGVNHAGLVNRYATFLINSKGKILLSHVNKTPGQEIEMDSIMDAIENRLFEISDGIHKDHSKLNELESHVIDNKGTERAYTGAYWDHKDEGVYVCRKCNSPLYWSSDKFDSHCGWPSFDDEIPGSVKHTQDADGYRTEITCLNCGGHLGHVFEGEGFTDNNIRHCVNSVSIKFISIDDYQN